MGIYLPGMEMPKCCGNCKLFDGSHAIGLFAPLGWCRVNGKEVFFLSEKADFCPLVPVPAHGRLIDADALFDFILNIYKTAQGDARKAYRDVLDTIVATGDAIPAEEGE